jgi:hypothetical protein
MSLRVAVLLRYAFMLRPDTVRRIWAILESQIGPPKVTAQCADHASREFSDVAKLLEFDNAKGKQIRSLALSAYSKSWERSADITFANESESISVSLQGTDNEVFQLKQDLLDVLGGTKAWYSALSRIELWCS